MRRHRIPGIARYRACGGTGVTEVGSLVSARFFLQNDTSAVNAQSMNLNMTFP